MFWDQVAVVYDVFVNVINRKTHKELRQIVSALIEPGDDVLECACGTGLLSVVIAQKSGRLTATDFSKKMLKKAEKNCAAFQNITFSKADITALAFPDKEAAYRETFRVLKPGGTFCGCFYVRGGCKRTDWFIRHLYQPKGFFTPPYETEQSLCRRLSGLYKEAEVTMVEGIGCFCCRK